jgi:hypothetical protein
MKQNRAAAIWISIAATALLIALLQLTDINGTRGFSYTHHPERESHEILNRTSLLASRLLKN